MSAAIIAAYHANWVSLPLTIHALGLANILGLAAHLYSQYRQIDALKKEATTHSISLGKAQENAAKIEQIHRTYLS